MPKAKRNTEEERALLLENEESFENLQRSYYPAALESSIAKGVANHVAKWPSHLLSAFLAASFVFGAFVLFALMTALFSVSKVTLRCRRSQNVDLMELPNIYFVKHANRTWSREEMCWIESSTRDNPETNVYLINLMDDKQDFRNEKNEKIEISENGNELMEFFVQWEQKNNFLNENLDLSSNVTMESEIKRILAKRYPNLRNIDASIEEFFSRSMLAHSYQNFDNKTLEIAAKAYILWNIPGVALHPLNFRSLRHLRSYLDKDLCKTLTTAAINLEGSIQASGVTCQAFIGTLIHEIAIHDLTNNSEIVEKARDSFCQRKQNCIGLKILEEDLQSITEPILCPTIYTLENQSTTDAESSTHRN